MKQKTVDQLISAAITVVVAFATSFFTIQYKLSDTERDKLNQNFKGMEKAVGQINKQQFLTTMLLSKLVYTRKDWEPEDFREAVELLNDIKNNSNTNFDAVTMSLGTNKPGNCDTFRKFYQENQDLLDTNSSVWLKTQIEHCAPNK